MLKFQSWYAYIWLIIICLYSFSWSLLNTPLYPSLLIFFIITIIVSLYFSFISLPVSMNRLIWIKQRLILTPIIIIGFLADWAYRGNIPIFTEYIGFNPNTAGETTVGIPIIHVLLIAFTIYYSMYISYLYISDMNNRKYLIELLLLLTCLLFNNSRGYVVFCLFVASLIFLAFNYKGLLDTAVHIIILTIIIISAMILFISVMGNIRCGMQWNDCSFIEMIGYFNNYPSWLTKHFMWTYTYLTSPLANLNLNCMLYDNQKDAVGLLISFLPEQFSLNYLYTNIENTLIVEHLNVSTGFVTFIRSFGLIGLISAFVMMNISYGILRLLLRHFVVLETLGAAITCLLVVSMIFYNPFVDSAICYLPLFLIISSIYLKKQLDLKSIIIIKQ